MEEVTVLSRQGTSEMPAASRSDSIEPVSAAAMCEAGLIIAQAALGYQINYLKNS